MSANVLLNLLNELGEKDKMQGFDEHLITFPTEFYKFSNTGTRMQDSIYHMTLKSLFIPNFGGGRVVRWCWANFQCRGVLQFGLQ